MTAARGLVIVEALDALDSEVLATADPRAATPPCLFVTPPQLRFDGMCYVTATWAIYAIAPGPANLDAWQVLDGLLALARKALPIEEQRFTYYSLAPDAPLVPAYRMTFTESLEVPA